MTAVPKVKIAQCWDDGVLDDIRLTDILRKYQATASFNLNAGLHLDKRHCTGKHKNKEVFRLAAGELKTVYEGFTVANHTLSHPALTKLPIEQARLEIENGRHALEQLFGYPVEGFAYPFGDQNSEIHRLVRSAGHLYARGVTNTRSVFPPEDSMDFRPSCHFLAQNFWEEFEFARSSGAVFYFWGHSYELLTEQDWHAFDEKIRLLGEQGEWIGLPSLFSSRVRQLPSN